MSRAPGQLAAARDGVLAVVATVTVGVALTGVASAAYRPAGHVGDPLDWLRIACWATAMAVGAPLHVRLGADHGSVTVLPLILTFVLFALSARLGRRRPGRVPALLAGLGAAVATAVAGVVSAGRLTSYGRGVSAHFAVTGWPALVGAFVLVTLAATAAQLPVPDGWGRAVAAALRGFAVVAVVGALVGVGLGLWWLPPRAYGTIPALLGDGAVWLGGFGMGGRLDAAVSTPVPFLSGALGGGMVTGDAWTWSYAVLVVPLAAAVLAGRRQQRDVPAGTSPWAELGRAAAVGAVLWTLLAAGARLRVSGHFGTDVWAGSGGPQVLSTGFVGAVWGAVSAVAGIAVSPVPEQSAAAGEPSPVSRR